MSKKIRIPGSKYNKYALLLHQQKLIEHYYNFLKCRILNKVLVCTGKLKPTNCINTYSIKIEYVAGYEPKTTILFPTIDPSKEIHMYKDHSVCLHYPIDMIWNERIRIHEYTIPWICEWILFYEIYLINGNIWEGPESPVHFKESEKNINKNLD
jgi:hypothetical protein